MGAVFGRQSHLDVLKDWRKEMMEVRKHESGDWSEQWGTGVLFEEIGTWRKESHQRETPGIRHQTNLSWIHR